MRKQVCYAESAGGSSFPHQCFASFGRCVCPRPLRPDGSYVQPHWRSSPDGIPQNNFSYPGNLNPYTGKVAPNSSSRWDGLNGHPQHVPGYTPYGSRLFNIK